ncbi:ABC transporter permease [Nocardia stercoris]|uniref:ABC transporter permease n=1 Tax=Nocardia stercoris TaxID=2483361 RepID=A0A3M2L3X2_9NOCA|nr:ABC transporter permease [Nocardia stercoris]RMI31410.1 ABC transporter permease [Nocardia stercoris]
MATGELPVPRAIGLVAGREIDARLRSRAFLVMTLVLSALIAGALLLSHFLGNKPPAVQHVGLTTASAQLEPLVAASAQAAEQRVATSVVDPAAGADRIRSGSLDALITDVTDGTLRVSVKSDLNGGLDTVFTLTARQLALNQQVTALHGDPAVVGRAMAGATVAVDRLAPADPHRNERIGISSVVGVLMYVMLVMSIQLTGQGVVEEKSNRIVELLLSAIRPWELLVGKVIGIGVVTVLQVAVITAVGAGTATATGALHVSGSVVGGAAGWAVLWYLLGYLLFAMLIAAAASLVSRQEDLQGVATPVVMLVVASYLIGQFVLPGHPDNMASTVLSMIPLSAPVLMPMRAAYGVPLWQEAVAVALMLVTIAVTARVAGRIYSRSILQTGGRVRLGSVLRR